LIPWGFAERHGKDVVLGEVEAELLA
jgi:hypothetical protein